MRTNIVETKNKTGEEVELFGWVRGRRDHGKIIFIDLGDRSGVAQIVFTPSEPALYKTAEKLRPEWVVRVVGTVAQRPEKMVNKEISTGTIEIQPTKLEVLAEAVTPPFALDTDGREIGEEIRMKYRYLDLRRERMQKNMMLRHRIIKFMRNYLDAQDFVEIETPIISKSTPEGARDYVVPSRLYPGQFYALPQSPQQYKQLLMVAGFEKYYQIARAFRDEDTRGDRQPEFTQLDLEMSFTSQEEILDLMEGLFIDLVEKILPEHHLSQKPFPRLKHEEVMGKYGTDKPDLRKDKNDPHELAFAFVVDFPMFEKGKEDGAWTSAHHPFTMMKQKDLPYLETGELKKIRADSYDLVLNGSELASGSMRINNPEIQKRVFSALGLGEEQIAAKFGHMMEAFSFGAPPHGGIAPGIDRFVMIVANEPNIREVFSFPKTGDGRDLMMDAPSKLDPKQLEELHLEIKNSL